MRLLEHQSKSLLARHGLNFTAGRVCTTSQQASEAAHAIGSPSLVLKAQVPFGGRGKAGAVVFVEGAAEARTAAERLFAMNLRGHAVRVVSVEPKVMYSRELYAGVTWDTGAKLPVAILSATGGVDVEQSGRRRVARAHFRSVRGAAPFEGRDMARQLGIEGKSLNAIGAVLHQLAAAFVSLDGITIEINPLVETGDGMLLGLDAHVELDDDAAYRLSGELQELGPIENSSAGRPPTALEREAQRIDATDHRGVAGRVVEFDGDLALLIGGGGASLTVFDAIRHYGGKPANYCEVGGNPTEEKVAALVALLLEQAGSPQDGGDHERGQQHSGRRYGPWRDRRRSPRGRVPSDTIIVFRIPGSWEPEADAILAAAGIEPLGREVSLDAAASLAVQRARIAAGSPGSREAVHVA